MGRAHRRAGIKALRVMLVLSVAGLLIWAVLRPADRPLPVGVPLRASHAQASPARPKASRRVSWPSVDRSERRLPASPWFVDDHHGYGLAEGCGVHSVNGRILGTFQVYTTSTAGRTWRPGPVLRGHGSSQACGERVFFANHQDGWVYGYELWATRDGGRTWTKEPLANVDVLAGARGRVWALVSPCGLDGSCQERLYRSVPGQVAWHRARPLPPQMFTYGTDLLPVTASTLFLLSTTEEGKLWRTTDSGRTWEFLRGCGDHGVEVTALDVQHLWLACADQASETASVYNSVDGGEHWTLLASNPYAFEDEPRVGHLPQGELEQIAALSQHALVMSYDKFGALLRSTDEGRSWRTILSPPSSAGFVLQFVSPLVGWADSYGEPALFVTRDGGRYWKRINTRQH